MKLHLENLENVFPFFVFKQLRPEAYDQFLRNGKYNLLKIDRPSLEVKTTQLHKIILS